LLDRVLGLPEFHPLSLGGKYVKEGFGVMRFTRFLSQRRIGKGVAIRARRALMDALEPRQLLSSIPFTYTLQGSARTSAGVYTTGSNPTLVCTLWSGTTQPAGTYNNTWNGLEDNGTAAPAGNYTIKVLENNVQYTWEGVIGNTSSTFTTTTGSLWRGFNEPADLSFSTNGGPAVTALGYNEGQSGVYTFATTNPESPSPFIAPDQNVCWIYAVSDNSHIYLANGGCGWDTANNTFIESYNMNGTVAGFSNGTTANIYNSGALGESYNGVIDESSQGTSTFSFSYVAQHQATGLAVQQTGNVLAVSHSGLNVVNLFDKISGASLGTISITAPGQVGFAPNGDLWVITGTSVKRFAAATLGTTNTAATTITGLAAPEALGVDPTTSNVLVADGGTSQQVKCYNSTGTLQWTYGTAGGYPVNGPAVTTNKFWFILQPNTNYGDGTAVINQTYLAVQPDGSWWVGDGGNDRALHFSSTRTYLGQIGYIGDNHQITVDPNNPTHVFVEGWLQYNLNYNVPLQPGDPNAAGGNASWTLVDNWAAGTSVSSGNDYSGFLSVDTLTWQGQTRTYALMYQNFNSSLSGFDVVALLPASGPLQVVDTTTSTNIDQWMDSQGDLRYAASNGTTYTITQQAFAGWDSSNNLLWGSPTTLASAPATAGTPMEYDPSNEGWEKPMTYPTTASGLVISYNGGAGTTSYPDYHLGGIPVGGTAWAFQTSEALNLSYPDGQGHYTSESGYGGHDGTQAWVVGHNIIWNYDGQYDSFSNQYAQYWDDGLFVGQFGASTAANDYLNASAGYAGNYGETYVVQGTDGNLYAFSADEGVHGGAAVWKISSLDSIQEVTGIGTLGQSQTVSLTNGTPSAPSGLAVTVTTAGQIKLNWTDNSNNETGFKIDQATTSDFLTNLTSVTVGANVTSYTATGISAGTTYYYRVRATNAVGDSANTATVSASTAGAVIPVPDGDFTDASGNVINTNTGGGLTFTSPMSATLAGWNIRAVPSTGNGGFYANWEPYGVLDNVVTSTGATPYNMNAPWISSQPASNYQAFSYYPGELYTSGNVVGGPQPGASLTMTTTGISAVAVAGATYTASILYSNVSWSVVAANPSANVAFNILANGVVVGTGTLAGLMQGSPWTPVTATWTATSAFAGQAIQLQVVANNFLEGPGPNQIWEVPTFAFTHATLSAIVSVGPAWLATNSTATWNATTHALTVTGPSTIIADPGTDEPLITASGAAAMLTINTGSTAAVNIGSITLTNGASVVVSDTGGQQVLVVQQGASNLSIDSTSKFDLGKNYLDLQNSGSNITAIDTLLQRGFGNGTWNGTGLTSSDANADTHFRTALGSIINGNQFNSTHKFDGVTPGSNDILIRDTYYGDADLSGAVNGNDYTLIDAGFGSGGTLKGWQNGDFNYDTHIDGSDYSLIDNTFNQQAAPMAEVATSAAQIAPSITTNGKSSKAVGSAMPPSATVFASTLGGIGQTVDNDMDSWRPKRSPKAVFLG
jgi:Fibronectin type III domain/FlgD Ig-like domain